MGTGFLNLADQPLQLALLKAVSQAATSGSSLAQLLKARNLLVPREVHNSLIHMQKESVTACTSTGQAANTKTAAVVCIVLFNL